jgi:hypothetical protein
VQGGVWVCVWEGGRTKQFIQRIVLRELESCSYDCNNATKGGSTGKRMTGHTHLPGLRYNKTHQCTG